MPPTHLVPGTERLVNKCQMNESLNETPNHQTSPSEFTVPCGQKVLVSSFHTSPWLRSSAGAEGADRGSILSYRGVLFDSHNVMI